MATINPEVREYLRRKFEGEDEPTEDTGRDYERLGAGLSDSLTNFTDNQMRIYGANPGQRDSQEGRLLADRKDKRSQKDKAEADRMAAAKDLYGMDRDTERDQAAADRFQKEMDFKERVHQDEENWRRRQAGAKTTEPTQWTSTGQVDADGNLILVNSRTGEYRTGPQVGKKPGDMAPEDQEVVKDLAKKNAHKISIANQIDAVMAGWDDLSDDQKVTQGRQLLKTLNSSEGADAIGAEEAKRLGSKLEFAMGNLFNSNPVQFGRDLPGFKEQATSTAKSLRSAAQMNDAEIAKRKGPKQTPPPGFDQITDAQILQVMKDNPELNTPAKAIQAIKDHLKEKTSNGG